LLSLLALSATADPIQWADLGLRSYLFEIGAFQLRYYSLAYLIGIIFAYWHTSKMLKEPGAPMAQRHAEDLFFYCTLGVILGGRLGYAARTISRGTRASFTKPDWKAWCFWSF